MLLASLPQGLRGNGLHPLRELLARATGGGAAAGCGRNGWPLRRYPARQRAELNNLGLVELHRANRRTFALDSTGQDPRVAPIICGARRGVALAKARQLLRIVRVNSNPRARSVSTTAPRGISIAITIRPGSGSPNVSHQSANACRSDEVNLTRERSRTLQPPRVLWSQPFRLAPRPRCSPACSG